MLPCESHYAAPRPPTRPHCNRPEADYRIQYGNDVREVLNGMDMYESNILRVASAWCFWSVIKYILVPDSMPLSHVSSRLSTLIRHVAPPPSICEEKLTQWSRHRAARPVIFFSATV